MGLETADLYILRVLRDRSPFQSLLRNSISGGGLKVMPTKKQSFLPLAAPGQNDLDLAKLSQRILAKGLSRLLLR